jgi:hypothetical protein
MTHLQISLWKRLAQVDFEENKFLQALSSYAKALRSALSICIEEGQVDIQCLYRGTMACVILAISQAGYSKELRSMILSLWMDWLPRFLFLHSLKTTGAWNLTFCKN